MRYRLCSCKGAKSLDAQNRSRLSGGTTSTKLRGALFLCVVFAIHVLHKGAISLDAQHRSRLSGGPQWGAIASSVVGLYHLVKVDYGFE